MYPLRTIKYLSVLSCVQSIGQLVMQTLLESDRISYDQRAPVEPLAHASTLCIIKFCPNAHKTRENTTIEVRNTLSPWS